MSLSVESALSNCFDQTTPSGTSSNPFMALWNSIFFKNAHVPIQSGVKDLYGTNANQMALLMFLFTETWGQKDTDLVLEGMRKRLDEIIGDTKLKPATLDKLHTFLEITLANYKYYPVNRSMSIIDICKKLGINKADWARKGRPSAWSQWYVELFYYLYTEEKEATVFLEPYINKTQGKLAEAFG